MENDRENEKNINKISNIEEKVEAIIFLSKEMVTVKELAQFYRMESFEMEKILLSLKNRE